MSIQLAPLLAALTLFTSSTLNRFSNEQAKESSTSTVCGNDKILFYCRTTNGKKVEICDAGETIRYAYGKIRGRPEIALSIERNEARMRPWNGIGRWVSYSVLIRNGATTYEASIAFDRLSDEDEAGIYVFADGELVAEIPCKLDTVRQSINSTELTKAEENEP